MDKARLPGNIWTGVEKGNVSIHNETYHGLEKQGRKHGVFTGKGLVKTNKFWGV